MDIPARRVPLELEFLPCDEELPAALELPILPPPNNEWNNPPPLRPEFPGDRGRDGADDGLVGRLLGPLPGPGGLPGERGCCACSMRAYLLLSVR